MLQGMFGKRLAEHFSLLESSSLVLGPKGNSQVALTRMRMPNGFPGPTPHIPDRNVWKKIGGAFFSAGVFLTCAWSQGKLSGCVDTYANAERLSWTHSTHSRSECLEKDWRSIFLCWSLPHLCLVPRETLRLR